MNESRIPYMNEPRTPPMNDGVCVHVWQLEYLFVGKSCECVTNLSRSQTYERDTNSYISMNFVDNHVSASQTPCMNESQIPFMNES